MISSQPIFHIHADLGEIVDAGATPYGGRRVIEILGGRVTGRLNGRIMTGGADWQIIRTDGVADIQARYVIETDGGSRVLVMSSGLRHGPPDVLAAIARGEKTDPSSYYFRTVLRFEASDPSLAWLNRILAIARGERERLVVKLDVFEVL
jgi:flavin-dependent dehydrogenase